MDKIKIKHKRVENRPPELPKSIPELAVDGGEFTTTSGWVTWDGVDSHSITYTGGAVGTEIQSLDIGQDIYINGEDDCYLTYSSPSDCVLTVNGDGQMEMTKIELSGGYGSHDFTVMNNDNEEVFKFDTENGKIISNGIDITDDAVAIRFACLQALKTLKELN